MAATLIRNGRIVTAVDDDREPVSTWVHEILAHLPRQSPRLVTKLFIRTSTIIPRRKRRRSRSTRSIRKFCAPNACTRRTDRSFKS